MTPGSRIFGLYLLYVCYLSLPPHDNSCSLFLFFGFSRGPINWITVNKNTSGFIFWEGRKINLEICSHNPKKSRFESSKYFSRISCQRSSSLQLDLNPSRNTWKINLPTNQKGYDTFETTVGNLSTRSTQICRVYLCKSHFDLFFKITSKIMPEQN